MKILVIDTETTGLNGYPRDDIVEIAICEVNTEEKTVFPVLSQFINYDFSKWSHNKKNAWIFNNSDITIELLENIGVSLKTIVSSIQILVKDRLITSYNTEYDFYKFLEKDPWELRKFYKILMPCLMLSSTNICKIPGNYGGYKWPSLMEAVQILKVEIPEEYKGLKYHSALGDTIYSSYVLLKLIENGKYELRYGSI